MRAISFAGSCKVITALIAATLLSACSTPMVSTDVAISSRISLSPSLDSTEYRPMPDWGQTISIFPGKSTEKMDPTYEAIKEQVQALLYVAKFEPVGDKHNADYKMTIDWSLKRSRVVQEYEEVPMMVPGPMVWHPKYGYIGHAGMRTVWVSQAKNTQLYLRSLILKLFEKNDKVPVYTATVSHESHCNQFNDAIPYLVRSAINNLYAANGTHKTDTVEETTPICQ